MIHFALIDRLPTGVTVEMMASEVAAPFQHGMDHLNAGDAEAAGEAFGALPEWMSDIVYLGGPGLLYAGKSASATVSIFEGVNDMRAGASTHSSVDLEPGDYALIAEVPNPQERGLMLPFKPFLGVGQG